MKINEFRKKKPFLWFLLVGSFLWIFPIELSMMLFSYDRISGCSWHLAGWGIIGIGMIFLTGTVPTLFCYLFSFIHRWLAWGVLFILWGLAMYYSIIATSPAVYYRSVLGEDLSQMVVMEKFRIADSFGDGHWALGYFSGNQKEILKYLNENFEVMEVHGYYSIDGELKFAVDKEGDLVKSVCWKRKRLSIYQDSGYFTLFWRGSTPQVNQQPSQD